MNDVGDSLRQKQETHSWYSDHLESSQVVSWYCPLNWGR